MRILFFFIAISLLVKGCVPVAQQGTTSTASGNYYSDKKFRTTDYMYEENIKTILLYPKPQPGADAAAAILAPPVITLDQSLPLTLEFDQLGNNTQNFRARLFHCNADWAISLLNDMDFLEDFNDFLFNPPQLSFNTKIQYVHYKFEVPRVKVPGNYVLMIYREGNVKDIVLTKRFMVVENRVSIASVINPSVGIQERNLNQQIEFAIRYPNYPITNPRQTVKVVVRKNYQWHTTITNLMPTSVKEDQATIEYHHFNLENNFAGGNEYRFFDMRSIRFLGMNMGKIDVSNDSTDVYLLPDKSRAKESYGQSNDLNGRFVIDNYETSVGATEADYVDVHFKLRAPEPAPGNVHIWGEFMNWTPSQETLLNYDQASQSYNGTYLMKQGFYNYMYVLEAKAGEKINETYFEGSHYNTENHYEIIVYYRPLGSRADLVIGYELIRHNSRR
jgi:hypothetical protein